MTARDPAVQRAMDRAAHELARRLDPWAAGMQDPAAFAVAYLEWCAGQGLRFIPPPHPALAPRTAEVNAETAHRGAARARDQLTRPKEEP